MGVKVTNNAFGELASGITDSATTLTLGTAQGTKFPVLGAGDFFFGTLIDTGNNLEIVKVTARSADTMTIVRGQDGTTARAYSAGDRFELRPTAAMFEAFTQAESIAYDNTTSGLSATTAQAAIDELENEKQVTLVSGTNIKTIGGESILGSGNIDPGSSGECIVTTFTSPGTWTKPATVKRVRVTVISGGGAGGGKPSPNRARAGGGGGGGGGIKDIPAPSIPGPVSVTRGAGGAGGTGTGGAGGTSSFGGFISATGGGGGTPGHPSGAGVGGAGGVVTGADLSLAGSNGGNNGPVSSGGGGAVFAPTTFTITTVPGGSYGSPATIAVPSVIGGISIFNNIGSRGGNGRANSAGAGGNAPTAFRGGGGGGCLGNGPNPAYNGGSGSAGIIVVEEFY